MESAVSKGRAKGGDDERDLLVVVHSSQDREKLKEKAREKVVCDEDRCNLTLGIFRGNKRGGQTELDSIRYRKGTKCLTSRVLSPWPSRWKRERAREKGAGRTSNPQKEGLSIETWEKANYSAL